MNTGRQWSFDFAKFVAIVGMVLVHTALNLLCYPFIGIHVGDLSLLLVGMAILAASAWLAHREPFSRFKV